jgi:Rps23 Pro-64 3,4-dihydroxylase Tpa1-like proline 4-hydroxylase
MGDAQYRINPALDAVTLADAFRAEGRLHIADFLAHGDAEQLHSCLQESRAWTLVMNQGDRLLELDQRLQADITPQKQLLVDQAVYAAARDGFQFRYENIRVPDDRASRFAGPAPLKAFADFLSSDAVLSFMRAVTGADDIVSSDARATAYGPGHFLTVHNDNDIGETRRVAYVFNLTKQWQADWGGLLTFPDQDNRRAEAFIPAFNAMNLFAVPQPHSVSFVAPFAGARRYSVTGWLHAAAIS